MLLETASDKSGQQAESRRVCPETRAITYFYLLKAPVHTTYVHRPSAKHKCAMLRTLRTSSHTLECTDRPHSYKHCPAYIFAMDFFDNEFLLNQCHSTTQ